MTQCWTPLIKDWFSGRLSILSPYFSDHSADYGNEAGPGKQYLDPCDAFLYTFSSVANILKQVCPT